MNEPTPIALPASPRACESFVREPGHRRERAELGSESLEQRRRRTRARVARGVAVVGRKVEKYVSFPGRTKSRTTRTPCSRNALACAASASAAFAWRYPPKDVT
ncbi:hypothetical protein AKJ09_09784 [Labilithrix luteola]|uniref:Uncharacterized protein n=1 Tax=Labilithrix luteola TaxID=1391654 RepID=A0A0K1QBF7_9BACT|nr:hypothetical protein AKJ09_09784 [Labilithrix luteola]